ncbi:MAG: hypothetical protein CMK07_15875 [Ponticaulis sp.]|nr:hypothetical protein [Ponticaulis sp.]
MELTPQQLLNGLRNAKDQSRQDMGVDILRRLILETQTNPKVLGNDWEEVLGYALAFADEDSAVEVAKRLVDTFPNNARHVMTLAERYSRVGESEFALELINRLDKALPNNPAVNYFQGVYSGHVGKLEDAKFYFRKAVKQKADFGDGWAMLAASGGLTDNDLQTLTSLTDGSNNQSMPGAAYALGTLYHAQGDAEAAWDAWSKANAFQRVNKTFNRDGEIAAHKAVAEADQKIPASSRGSDFPNPLPKSIFIVGLPRSGTSLTEQIFAQQPMVRPLGETMISRVSTWPLGNLQPVDLAMSGVYNDGETEIWDKLGGIYRFCAGGRTKGETHVTDKGALLHLFVGALARALPEAKFVWVRRDPRDIALSAFRAHLSDGKRWRHDLADMAAYMQAHEELMMYWQNRFPDRILELRYENLVQTPQVEIDRLMTFAELPGLDINGVDFTGATVGTASFAQIRSKISPASVGGWKRYQKHIAPHFGG